MKFGRKTKLSYEIQEGLVAKVRSGLGLRAAARSVGISRPTFFRWLAKGREELAGPHAELVRRIYEAQGVAGAA